MNFLLAVVAGLLCGVISGFGIGGGSLLMVWLTAVVGMEQIAAQSINLLYFLPTAGAALILHIKNKQLCKEAILPAALLGCIFAALGAILASSLDSSLLKRFFGGFLILVGISEIMRKIK